MKVQKNGGVVLGGQDGCEQRIKVFLFKKIKKNWGVGSGGRVGGSGWM